MQLYCDIIVLVVVFILGLSGMVIVPLTIVFKKKFAKLVAIDKLISLKFLRISLASDYRVELEYTFSLDYEFTNTFMPVVVFYQR